MPRFSHGVHGKFYASWKSHFLSLSFAFERLFGRSRFEASQSTLKSWVGPQLVSVHLMPFCFFQTRKSSTRFFGGLAALAHGAQRGHFSTIDVVANGDYRHAQ